jgi:hypothetical protein
MSSSITPCGQALIQSSQPLQYLSLTSIQPFTAIGSPFDFQTQKISLFGETLSLHYMPNHTDYHAFEDVMVVPCVIRGRIQTSLNKQPEIDLVSITEI